MYDFCVKERFLLRKIELIDDCDLHSEIRASIPQGEPRSSAGCKISSEGLLSNSGLDSS